ncbi:sensor histidine kinase [Panacibacter sp. KCS-6]|uniref:Sensor histidine kinase n=2 Tax=Limnovirga soli TaxID=2656915 RepID=A0A8J8JRQ7_9BACT|nr:sensor histidine kinase [Limnovirga soli]
MKLLVSASNMLVFSEWLCLAYIFALMKKGKLPILIHVTSCITFLCLPILVAPDFPRSADILHSIPTQERMLAYLLLIGYFYLNYFVLIPKLYNIRRFRLFGLLTVLCFVLVSVVPAAIISHSYLKGTAPANMPLMGEQGKKDLPPDWLENPPTAPNPQRMPPPYNDDLGLMITQYLFIFLAVAFFSGVLNINNRLKDTEAKKFQAELMYLKSQINPHFLFNTLNSIYSLAIEKSDNTPIAIVKLSEMMRYVLNEAETDFVPLEKELAYISNYIALQKIRFEDAVKINFRVEGSLQGKKIAPLVIIPFIENAFKYGVNAEDDAVIDIVIQQQQQALHLMVLNKKVIIQKSGQERTGLGIQNTRDRLALLYPGAHVLTIENNSAEFIVHLTIQLQ